MKKIFLMLAFGLFAILSSAQTPLPMDPAIKYGKLPNGLTYYVRHNEEPKGQAEFFIAQNVGSMQEEDNQLGLAHFLEHMCFNGTTHFPGKNLINYLETIGVEFGRNLNAYTAFDETVYNISAVPVSREGIVDSCLLVLHDWSHDLLLEDAEIDAERGVIHEEWRTANASRRMYTNLLPQVFPGNRYGYRMPIGTMDIIDNFPYEDLRNYYRTWYRPDLQAVVVVGDIDADEIVAKIEKMFADIPAPVDPKERVWESVEDNEEPIVAMVSDKEQTVNQLIIMFKTDAPSREEKGSAEYFQMAYMLNAICGMINNRIEEMTQKPNPPFIGAAVAFDEFFVSRTKYATALYAAYADGNLEKCATAMLTELQRAARYGFNQSEYDRWRDDYLRKVEQVYTEREKHTSNAFARECARNFTTGEAMPGIEVEYQLTNMMAPMITVDMLNQVTPMLITDNNLVIALMMTEAENAAGHTTEELLDIVKNVQESQIEAYIDEVIDRPLLENIPTGGKIVSVKDGVFGTKILTLGNGVRVILKDTDFQKDEIQMASYRNGGVNTFEDADFEQTHWINTLHGVMGLGAFSATDLPKVLAGKHVSVNARVAEQSEQVSGSCSVRDFETMMQLTTLSFTPQRMDDEALASFKQRQRQALENQQANPMKSFADTLRTKLTKNKKRLLLETPEIVDRIDVEKVCQMYNSRFDHADGFTFIMVGNLSGDSLYTQIADYLGNLPVNGVKDKLVDREKGIVKGEHVSMFNRQMEMDRSTVYIVHQASVKATLQNQIYMDAFEQALQKGVHDKMREEAGATYSPGVASAIVNSAFGDYGMLYIVFETNPEMRDTLIEIAHAEAARIAKEGVSEEQLEKTRQLLLKNHTEALRKNDYFVDLIQTYYRYNIDEEKDYEKIVNSLNSKAVQQFAKKFLSQKNMVLVSMSPEK